MKHIMIGLFIALLCLNFNARAGMVTVCDVNGNCRQVIVFSPPGTPDTSNGTLVIDTGE